jgi:hypothetical protein
LEHLLANSFSDAKHNTFGIRSSTNLIKLIKIEIAVEVKIKESSEQRTEEKIKLRWSSLKGKYLE